MNANEFLKKQHRDVQALYEEFKAADGDAKDEIGKKLLTALVVHDDIEDELYYPELEKVGLKDSVEEYRAEHVATETNIGRLKTMDHEDDEFEPTMKAMMEGVNHHIEEEETQGMPKFEALVDPGVLADLGAKLDARSKELHESTLKRLWATLT
ncbi:MAG TPA: hemerythrin domain-containing protein [Candidatus Paceibacterota bacterium]|nr:hemerythrin domain-containing protein [Candidatus Paceibacterota bacterium]